LPGVDEISGKVLLLVPSSGELQPLLGRDTVFLPHVPKKQDEVALVRNVPAGIFLILMLEFFRHAVKLIIPIPSMEPVNEGRNRVAVQSRIHLETHPQRRI
jgi:hypothetical protein